MNHNEKIIEQFSLQAKPFSALPGHSDAMQMLINMSSVRPTDKVLDVACGPGLVACEFALCANHVTGIDITPKMIEEASNRQKDKNLSNMSWRQGSVLPLPFSDSEFTLVLTRYSFHHFISPLEVMLEMVRVCKPGGKVMVVDVVLASENVEAFNEMELLRDPSHTKALSFNEMADIFEKSGLKNIKTSSYKVDMELEAQLAASFPNKGDDEIIRNIFREDIQSNKMGVNARYSSGNVLFSYPILICVGEKIA